MAGEPAALAETLQKTVTYAMHDGRGALTRNRPPFKIVESPGAAAGQHSMHIIDSHFHWWPRSIF